ncbi:flavodoxin domain-containing protein [Paludicola sp. MB14-C6]|uniref:flavodoxin domain-containing protein n=1 Tax=Paludihabitans sp. MB14-C6 TaxID=3070656 RepID=UPI0027DD368E|nr:flavodoxin domain-containing protein [Paludicola sp. MB14-C6]WMJ22077.1 flavodoxin domain-containing protein [Paludicola sp. MB14-C6]
MKSIILYASKYGSTKTCAEALAKKLHGDVELIQIANDTIPNLNSYDHIILGSPIKMGTIDPKIRAFCKEHEEALFQHNVAMFICSAIESQIDVALKASIPQKLYDHIHPIQYVGGIMDAKHAKFFDKMIINLAAFSMKKEGKALPQIEYGNIEALANSINAQ